MEPFKIHILGCGSALPTLRHNASSQIVEIRGKMFMVDCAEAYTDAAAAQQNKLPANTGRVYQSHAW